MTRQWVIELHNGRPIGEIIDDIFAQVQTAEGEDRRELESELAGFLLTAERNREALQILDEISERDPDNVRPLIDKATYCLYLLDEPEEALRSIDLALQRAYRAGFFRREALGMKARMLLKSGRGEALSQTLEEIMSLEIKKDIPDIGPERDFVDQAPPGLISEEVLARYNKFCPKWRSETVADEPPNESPEAGKDDTSGALRRKAETARKDVSKDYMQISYPVERDSWDGTVSEGIWVKPVKVLPPFRAIVEVHNIPFSTRTLSCGDKISVVYKNRKVTFEAIVERGGHSTYHVLVETKNSDVSRMLDTLGAMGCGWEGGDHFSHKIYAVDVPPEVDVDEVYDLLDKGQKEGHWLFQGGYIGHPPRDDTGPTVV